MSRPWTPGPWRYRNTERDSGATGTYEIHVRSDPEWRAFLSNAHYYASAPESRADAQLIALAPEMAEAILAHECGSSGHEVAGLEGCGRAICRIALRLRQIS